MLVTKQIEIDMGHRVLNHKSKCKHMHGHRYVIELGVDDKLITTEGISDEGMVIDFGDLKSILMSEIDARFDHKFIMYEKDWKLIDRFNEIEKDFFGIVLVNFIPTAENLAKHWYELIKSKLQERNIAIKYVKVWETPTSTATYEE